MRLFTILVTTLIILNSLLLAGQDKNHKITEG